MPTCSLCGPEREGRGDAPAVGDAARGDHRQGDRGSTTCGTSASVSDPGVVGSSTREGAAMAARLPARAMIASTPATLERPRTDGPWQQILAATARDSFGVPASRWYSASDQHDDRLAAPAHALWTLRSSARAISSENLFSASADAASEAGRLPCRGDAAHLSA